MCGIISYVGKRQAAAILLDGLTTLEYRGYDSAGIYLSETGRVRSVGGIDNLRKKLPSALAGKSGIGHLRWATHGEPTEANAHPHADCKGNIHVVHNGIIENYQSLKQELVKAGHSFASETDTEVIAHLIEEHMKQGDPFEEASKRALSRLTGTYGLSIASASEPEKIIVARMGAPVVLGIGKGEMFAASDASPILRHTKDILFLRDREYAILSPDRYDVFTFEHERVVRAPEAVSWEEEKAGKEGYDHFMLKEIMEGPEVIRNTIRGRLLREDGSVKLGGLEAVKDRLKTIDRIVIVGCGTAYYAGQVGEYMLEEYAGIPAETEAGSEFRYRKPVLDERTMLLAISQSGETADTLEAIREAKRKGALTVGIVNVVGSTIARETDAGIHNHAGPEIGVASTKAFISQVVALALLAVFLGRQRALSRSVGQDILSELESLPEKIVDILEQKDFIHEIVKEYGAFRDFLFIGRKYNYPIAYEGALKLKEVSYVHAEGCGAGEMKHGPLAMIDANFPTMAICLDDSVREKMLSNVQEIRARKGKVVMIATEGDQEAGAFAERAIYVPKTMEMLSPILSVVPLQLFAYYVALEKGLNVDRPRNLAKSVTVE